MWAAPPSAAVAMPAAPHRTDVAMRDAPSMFCAAPPRDGEGLRGGGGGGGGDDDDATSRHVTIWNRDECRKIAGNAAPLSRNLERYLRRHPECEVFNGQDRRMDASCAERAAGLNEHVAMWHRLERRKVTGNAAPLRKNLAAYLARHPECEEYDGQDRTAPPCDAPPPQANAPLAPPPFLLTPTATAPFSAEDHAPFAPPSRSASAGIPIPRRGKAAAAGGDAAAACVGGGAGDDAVAIGGRHWGLHNASSGGDVGMFPASSSTPRELALFLNASMESGGGGGGGVGGVFDGGGGVGAAPDAHMLLMSSSGGGANSVLRASHDSPLPSFSPSHYLLLGGSPSPGTVQ